jgi:hypothetical protein
VIKSPGAAFRGSPRELHAPCRDQGDTHRRPACPDRRRHLGGPGRDCRIRDPARARNPGSIHWGSGPLLAHKVAAAADGLGGGALRGVVRIKRRGARHFTPLGGGGNVPFGAQLDARRGTLHLRQRP